MKALTAFCAVLGLSGCVAVPIVPLPRIHVAVPVPALVVRPAAPIHYGYPARHWHRWH